MSTTDQQLKALRHKVRKVESLVQQLERRPPAPPSAATAGQHSAAAFSGLPLLQPLPPAPVGDSSPSPETRDILRERLRRLMTEIEEVLG